jgi:hypothetical protein
MDFIKIKLKEQVQCGDIFMIKFFCPFCESENFTSFPATECYLCKTELKDSEYVLAKGRNKRVISGTVRKNKKSFLKEIRFLLESQGKTCAYCEAKLETEYHVDHIIPVSVGGTNTLKNLVLSCSRCNLFAGGKCFSSFSIKKLYIISKIALPYS